MGLCTAALHFHVAPLTVAILCKGYGSTGKRWFKLKESIDRFTKGKSYLIESYGILPWLAELYRVMQSMGFYLSIPLSINFFAIERLEANATLRVATP